PALYMLCSSYLYTVFFVSFQRVRHPRALPSFPTRRSSDLWRREWSESSSLVNADRLPYRRSFRATAGASAAYAPAVARKLRRYRSEEHTSELQSLRHLVCRLLLEKKKKKQMTKNEK